MSNRAEEKAQEYEKSLDYYHYTSDNPSVAYQKGYEQAEKETIERAWEWMTSAKGEHTFEDFRKAMEEE